MAAVAMATPLFPETSGAGALSGAIGDLLCDCV